MFREKLQGQTKNLAISETARNNKVVVCVAIFVPRFVIPLHRKLLRALFLICFLVKYLFVFRSRSFNISS